MGIKASCGNPKGHWSHLDRHRLRNRQGCPQVGTGLVDHGCQSITDCRLPLAFPSCLTVAAVTVVITSVFHAEGRKERGAKSQIMHLSLPLFKEPSEVSMIGGSSQGQDHPEGVGNCRGLTGHMASPLAPNLVSLIRMDVG